MAFGALCDEEGRAGHNIIRIGNCTTEKWSPVFAKREAESELLGFVEEGDEWWEQWRETVVLGPKASVPEIALSSLEVLLK